MENKLNEEELSQISGGKRPPMKYAADDYFKNIIECQNCGNEIDTRTAEKTATGLYFCTGCQKWVDEKGMIRKAGGAIKR